jgi:hypothetical protein
MLGEQSKTRIAAPISLRAIMGVTITHNADIASGQLLVIRPPCREILAPLRTHSHYLANDPERGCEIITQHASLVANEVNPAAMLRLSRRPEQEAALFARLGMDDPRDPGIDNLDDDAARCTTCRPGLLPAVVALLERGGRKVNVQGREVVQLGSPQSVVGFTSVDAPFLNFLRIHDRGIVRHGASVSPANLIAQAAAAYPNATIAIASSRADDANHAADRLMRTTSDVKLLRSGDPEAQQIPRIVVGTYRTLKGIPQRLRECDVFFALNVNESLGEEGQRVLGRAWRARILGCLSSEAQLAPRDIDDMRAHFGFAEVDLPQHGCRPLPVDVLLLPMRGGPRIALSREDLLVLKRKAVWLAPVRNRRIARLARLLHQPEDAGRLLEDFSHFANVALPDRPRRVAVLTENLEHAYCLVKLIPGGSIVADHGLETGSSAPRPQQMLGNDTGPLVVTFAGLERIELARFDVLIRADPGTGMPPMEVVDLVIDNLNDRRLLLVDFADRGHPALRARSQGRRRAYLRQGWFAPGADPIRERVNLFLADRPRGDR